MLGVSSGDNSPFRAWMFRRTQLRGAGGRIRDSLGGVGGVCKTWAMGVIGERVSRLENREERWIALMRGRVVVGVRPVGVPTEGVVEEVCSGEIEI